MKTVALVPMKGNSERVPGKNLRVLCGKPLCRWILDTLSAVPEIDLVVVNTDSEAIADVAMSAGAVVHRRSPEVCGDDVSMNRVIRDDLLRIPDAELVLQTHATNPLLTAASVSKAIRSWDPSKYDSYFSVTRHHARFFDAGLNPLNHDPSELRRTQDLDPVFEENSCLYLFSAAKFHQSNNRLGERRGIVELEALESVDIDEESDWFLAQALIEAQARLA